MNAPAAGTRGAWVGVFGMVLLAHAPLIALYLMGLWRSPYYQFFPLSILGAFLLARRAWARTAIVQPGSPVWNVVGYAAAMTLLLTGALMHSPWLGMAALLIALATAAHHLGGRALLIAMLPAWLMLATFLRLPLSLDEPVTLHLQQASSVLASRTLDAMGVIHGLEGITIELPNRSVTVEEACSGINSLFSLLAVALFFVLWTRRPWWHAVAVMALTPVVVIMANVVRITVSTVYPSFASAEDHAVRHAMLGLACFALAMILTWSTDRLVCYFGAWTTDIYATSRHGRREARIAHTWPIGGRAATAWTAAFALLAVVQLAAISLTHASAPSTRNAPVLPTLGEDALPETVGPWRRVKFKTVDRAPDSAFGQHSQQWVYQSDLMQATVSFDYPFDRWHDVINCYRLEGWTQGGRTFDTSDGATGASASMIVADLAKPELQQHAAVLFTLVDRGGESTAPTQLADAPVTMLEHRLKRAGLVESGVYVQIQVMVESFAPLSPEMINQAKPLFEQAVNVGSRRWREKNGGATGTEGTR
ncbi:MAG: exosortase U [Phycisphaera sp.]|nr:exosortase U [Phycisphaera sp.]